MVNIQLKKMATRCNLVLVLFMLYTACDHALTDGSVNTMDCDFDRDMCGYTQDQNDRFDWTRRSLPSGTAGTGPSTDHTLRNGNGYYMYIEVSSPIKQGWQARLRSPVISAPRSDSCLEFYYHMYGIRMGTLNVIMNQTAQADQVTWSKSGDQGDKWYRGLVDIPGMTADAFQITFEGIRGNGKYSDIAIDDIHLSNESCFIGRSCDFENDLCLVQETDDDFDWRRQSGNTGSFNTGPITDHTLGNSTGYYIYIETSSPRLPNDVAKISTPRIRAQSSVCLTFWYHMFGQHIETLNVVVNTTDGLESEQIWSKSGNQGNVWRPAEITIDKKEDDFKVVFEGIRGLSYQGDIAIDDVNITDSACISNGTTDEIGISCTFEEPEICGYTQDPSEDIDWIWQNFATESVGTGPTTDHTLGNGLGFYMYIETSLPSQPGDRARLQSPFQNHTSHSDCLEFWYHMHGPTVEQLKVFIKLYGETLTSPVWSLSGNHGDYWHRATVDFQPTAQFAIVFEGIAGSANFGDIAIDDVKLYEGTCPTMLTTPLPPTEPPTLVTDASCDFEESGWCKYTQAIYDDFDWTRQSGSTTSFNTGPSTDHTYQNTTGYYIFIETSLQRFDSRARLYSPLIASSTNPICVQFWCHMFGETVDFLNVYVVSRQYQYILPVDPLLAVYGDHGDVWFHQQFEVKPTEASFYVVFEGIQGNSYTGDIAIDDILFMDSACTQITPTPATLESFCDFEFGIEPCKYTQDIYDDQFNWTLQAGETPTKYTGPTNDHTRGNERGRYIFIESSQPRRPNDKAVINSPKIAGTGESTCLQFWYHMYGKDIGVLRAIMLESGFKLKELWSKGIDQGDKWNEAVVEVPAVYSHFIVSFEASVGSQYGDIALDDINFLPYPCGTVTVSPTPSQQIGQEKCDFEKGPDACGITQITEDDDFDWQYFDYKQHVGITFLPTNTSYLFVSAAGDRQLGEKAKVITPIITSDKQSCFSMDFILRHDPSLAINVYSSAIGNIQRILTITGLEAYYWNNTLVEIPKMPSFSIIIEAVVGKEDHGILAIDNIVISSDICPGGSDHDGSNSTVFIVIGVVLGIVAVATVILTFWFFKRRGLSGTSGISVSYNEHMQDGAVLVASDMAIDNPLYNKSSTA